MRCAMPMFKDSGTELQVTLPKHDENLLCRRVKSNKVITVNWRFGFELVISGWNGNDQKFYWLRWPPTIVYADRYDKNKNLVLSVYVSVASFCSDLFMPSLGFASFCHCCWADCVHDRGLFESSTSNLIDSVINSQNRTFQCNNLGLICQL